MHHRFTLHVVLVALAGCVEVPDNVRAHFAQPSPAERTNYRPGNHGSARPLAQPAAKEAWMPVVNDGDAGATAATTTTTSATTPTEPAKEERKDEQPTDEAKDAGAPQ